MDEANTVAHWNAQMIALEQVMAVANRERAKEKASAGTDANLQILADQKYFAILDAVLEVKKAVVTHKRAAVNAAIRRA